MRKITHAEMFCVMKEELGLEKLLENQIFYEKGNNVDQQGFNDFIEMTYKKMNKSLYRGVKIVMNGNRITSIQK